jgi:hypothetical protein
LEEGKHIKYCATAHYLKLFYLSVPIDGRNSKLEGKLIAADHSSILLHPQLMPLVVVVCGLWWYGR